MKIALVYGGKSGEHEVSLASASSIARAIPKEHAIILIGITKKGAWYLQDAAMLTQIRADEKAVLSIKEDAERRVSVIPGGGCAGAFSTAEGVIQVDVVFPVLHGTFGEDGTIQGLFEMADVPYAGGGVMASAVAMDKEKTKLLWQQAGLPVVPFLSVKRSEWDTDQAKQKLLAKTESAFSYPVFVKPACAGSSVGAAKATNRTELERQVNESFLWDDKILIEPFVQAREIECSVTGNENPEAYAPGEIIPSHEFYDYDAKYIDPDGALLKIPADIPVDTAKRIREIAVRAYRTLDLSGFSRVDFFINKADNGIYLNEINTIPGFTSISMFPKMCGAAGLSYQDLVMKLLELAKLRFDERHRLLTSRQ